MLAPKNWAKIERAKREAWATLGPLMLETLKEIAKRGFGGNAARARKMVDHVEAKLDEFEEHDEAGNIIVRMRPREYRNSEPSSDGLDGFGDFGGDAS